MESDFDKDFSEKYGGRVYESVFFSFSKTRILLVKIHVKVEKVE